ncbi:MAG: ribosomal protein L11 methyltransferase [Legionella sp. 40-6]|nr:50S ribosomal protein L11 methyltransferase [Legionella sp.]OJY48718.1 MAG: ribosomal protein L11 methyltransferase [Legionella sp. 40-6]
MWYQLTIDNCPSETIESLSQELEDGGALSITYSDRFDNPVLEPEPGTTPLWPEVVLQVLYAEEEQAREVQESLLLSHPQLIITLEIIADKDWERVWMDDFKPQRFGNRLWICPTWSEPPEPSAVNLILDPGLAFGTGTHPTTSLCLTWLDQAQLVNKKLIDYGCGSGILSLAAVKLGAEKVYAVDIDPQALQATQTNAKTNEITLNQLEIMSPEQLHHPVDFIIANILLTPLLSLKQRFWDLLHPEGQLILSGILTEQATELVEHYSDGFLMSTHQTDKEWSLLVFNRKT